MLRVLRELEKREELERLIDLIVEKDFEPNESEKLKKGIVHARVAERLGVILSPDLRAIINVRMEALGHKESIRDGYRYFRAVKRF